MLIVERAPPYLTVQDAGRFGHRASGVPQAGAMDQWSLAAANIYAGNHKSAAALEWAIAGGSLRFEHSTTIGLAGADIDAAIDERPVGGNGSITIRAGATLKIRGITARRFLYVAIRGGVDCPLVLGSRSTYLPASFGGIEGRRLRTGDVLPIGRATIATGADRAAIDAEMPDFDAETIRIIPRPSNSGDELLIRFLEQSFTVSAASDRMGYRLESDQPLDGSRASITSEPVCPGTVQLTPSGQPIVLMADAPTIGGYHVIGTVATCDLPIIAQSLPRRTLRFESVSVAEAHSRLHRQTSE
jgi:antagonist of KipI